MTLWLHADEVPLSVDPADYVGSPMYDVLPEHGVAVAAVALLFGAVLLARRLSWAGALRSGYARLPSRLRFTAWLIATSGAIHLGLVVGHEPYFLSGLWLVGGVAMLAVTRRLLLGRRWRRWAALVLLGSILGYAVSSVAGEPPDQVGLATKLVELTALGMVLTAPRERRWRRLAASTATVSLIVVTGLAAWIGAFVSGDGGHHLGEVPAPGVLLPGGEDREPTARERYLAARLHAETSAGIARFADPAVAAAAGYDVGNIVGTDHHATNPAYQEDGHILDPARPETLVYAAGDRGPVLIGAMFEMPDIGQRGPTVGGPLTVWHAHDHVCFSLTPPALAGLTSPWGTCPVGSITVPVTGEMIHVWTLPGVEEPFGDLDDEWLRAYLDGPAAAGG